MMCVKLLVRLSALVALFDFLPSAVSWPRFGPANALVRWCWGPRRLIGWALRRPLAPRPRATPLDIP
eukprot:4100247-Pyramimonas_sp.AAC.1